MSKQKLLFFILGLISVQFIYGQEPAVMDYAKPQEYTLDTIRVTGINYLDPNVVIGLSGLAVGDKITVPGDAITSAIKKFWSQGLFSEVKIFATRVEGAKMSLEINLKERPRLGKLSFVGIKKSETDELNEKLKIRSGIQVTDELLKKITNEIKKHYLEKGYYNLQTRIQQTIDTTEGNRLNLRIFVEKNQKVKISAVNFTGNKVFTEKRLRRTLKKTKQLSFNFFKSHKFILANYKEDKNKLIDFYNENGYRDAKIMSDSVIMVGFNRVIVQINIFEGAKYHYRNITWIGNTKYSSAQLNAALGIKKGDIYNQKLLKKRLESDEDAVNSLYLDFGYLFFQLVPAEVSIINDSIDLEMRMYEGKQATINNVIIKGNTKTNEHVVRREIRTLPGELFSKEKIIRTVRELATLGHFDPEKIVPDPRPNMADGTVDIQYNLEEKANDQLEVSGGWGAGMLVGTLGIRFSNFSARQIFDPKAWRPVPSGDGQTLSLRAQSNGSYYRSYNVSFMEPWLGGTKPNSLSISAYNSKITDATYDYTTGRYNTAADAGYQVINGVSVGLGRRLSWPDDYFQLYNELSYQQYNMHNFNRYYVVMNNGKSNNLNFTTTISRNSISQPIYPRNGSNFSLSLNLTPPYSLIFNPNKDYTNEPQQVKYKWIEYFKWTFKSEYYLSLVDKLVMMTKAQYGFKGFYNKTIGHSPFEGYYVGGDGMVGYNYYGYEIVPVRGYSNTGFGNAIGALTPPTGANVYTKYTLEFRYPVSLNPSATVYGLTFLEAGNAWTNLNEFNPFQVRRSAGVGVRAFLPMFGMLGIDWGYGFDDIPWSTGQNHGQFHFTLGQQF
jgi:outer membrane protein insertion porin family